MLNAIIVHGCSDQEEYTSTAYPSPSNLWFIPWLQKQLLLKDVLTQTPEMPTPFRAEYDEWKKVIEQFRINNSTILVGHSCGAGFLLKWLGETEIKIRKLVLVAPWLDLGNTTNALLNFQLNSNVVTKAHEIHLLISDDDFSENVKESAEHIINTLTGIHIHRFKNKGHFVGIENIEQLELLQICLD